MTKITFDQVTLDQITLDQITLDQMILDQIAFDHLAANISNSQAYYFLDKCEGAKRIAKNILIWGELLDLHHFVNLKIFVLIKSFTIVQQQLQS